MTTSLQGFIVPPSPKQFGLLWLRSRRCRGFDSAPARYDFIVGSRVFGPARPFAKRIEPVRKLARCLRLRGDSGEHFARAAFAFRLEDADQVMQGFPNRKPLILAGIPVRRIVPPLQKPHDAATRKEHARMLHTINACALGSCER